MVSTVAQVEPSSLIVRLNPAVQLSDEQFFDLCQLNRELRIERTAEGALEIMPPTSGETGRKNAILTYHLTGWALVDGSGDVYDSSTGFKLSNGAVRAPDASWVPRSRLAGIAAQERERGFLPLCPDFVVELRSPSDTLPPAQEKLREYMQH
ncbi:MAG: Uma2 family endonuclease, partial [Chloroflexota bacterium]|nr:Uma2 family endonuclease [Chloroflexota bacterium]